MKSKIILLLHAFAIFSGTAMAASDFKLDFSTGAGTQAGWESIGGTGSPSKAFSGYTGLSDGNITVNLANIAFDRLYKNGFTGPADDFPGTDLDAMYSDLLFRNNDLATVDVTIGGLKAGTYQITTHHLNAPNTPSVFDFLVQDADSPSFAQFAGNFAMGLGNTSSFNPTIVTFEVVSNGTDPIILRLDATFIGTGGNTGGWFGFNGMEIAPAPAAAPFNLIITPGTTAGLYDFQWDSQPGKVYDLLTSTDLATPLASWPTYDDGTTLYENLPATGTSTTLTGVPSGVARRFFAMREEDAPPVPPLLSENFDDDNGSFTITKVAGTDWAWGDPDSTGPGGAVTTGNGGAGQCWGTNIGNPGYYVDPTTDTRLQSPRIDLTSVAAAELSFAQVTDFPAGDTAVVRLINDDTDVEIVSGVFPLTVTDIDTGSANWQTVGPITLPVGAPVRIEWSFTGSGDATDDYMGWYIDDVQVVEVAP